MCDQKTHFFILNIFNEISVIYQIIFKTLRIFKFLFHFNTSATVRNILTYFSILSHQNYVESIIFYFNIFM